MTERAVHQFIATVSLHFPRPKFNGDEVMEGGWMASMNRILGKYPDDVLASAADRIVFDRSTKDGRFFPLPSEITAICNEIMESKRALETPLLKAPENVPYTARASLAADLMKSPMGKLATKEGWDLSMFHFCVDNMRAPNGEEIEECKRKAAEFKAEYERCLKGERGNGRLWANIAEGMVRKAREAMGRPA